METLPDISANESHSTYRTKRTQFVLPNDVIEKLKASRYIPFPLLLIYCYSCPSQLIIIFKGIPSNATTLLTPPLLYFL